MGCDVPCGSTYMQPGAVNPACTFRGTSLCLCTRPSFSHCTRCLRFRQASASGHSGPRCEEALASSSADDEGTSSTALSVAAAVIIFGLSITIAVFLYRNKKRKWASLQAQDFQAEQDALGSSQMFSGLLATTDGGCVIPRELPRKTITITSSSEWACSTKREASDNISGRNAFKASGRLNSMVRQLASSPTLINGVDD